MEFLCEVLPRIRVMSTKFYLKSYFITKWKSPRREHRFLLLGSWSSPSYQHLRQRASSAALLRGAGLCRPLLSTLLPSEEPSSPAARSARLWFPLLFAALCPWRGSGICTVRQVPATVRFCWAAFLRTRNVVMKRGRIPNWYIWVRIHLYYSLAVWAWTSYSTSLGFSVPSVKRGW